MTTVSELLASVGTVVKLSVSVPPTTPGGIFDQFSSGLDPPLSVLCLLKTFKMKVSSRMGTEDDNQNSILKGILQNGSSFNYPGVCYIKLKNSKNSKTIFLVLNVT